MKINKAIISGGGTGGHIFPAIAIANKIKEDNPDAEILFVGAKGKMEMEKVPAAGYKIEGLWISGLQRKLTLKNFTLPFKIISSMLKARRIVKKFKPDVAVGVGGYASGPTLKAATMMGVPSLIQEQNSFAGKTNKLLGTKVQKVCVAYDKMERFFPTDKIVITGNPVREEVIKIEGKRSEALAHFKLDENKKTLLIIGGSLGARTLNDSVKTKLEEFQKANIQVIWQCGKLYINQLKEELGNTNLDGIILTDFISNMTFAYAAADCVISRAGAISISELSLVHKPCILVPSPNVAEDHQTKNALSLSEKGAAILIKDIDAKEQLVSTVLELMSSTEKMNELEQNIQVLGRENATDKILEELKTILK